MSSKACVFIFIVFNIFVRDYKSGIEAHEIIPSYGGTSEPIKAYDARLSDKIEDGFRGLRGRRTADGVDAYLFNLWTTSITPTESLFDIEPSMNLGERDTPYELYNERRDVPAEQYNNKKRDQTTKIGMVHINCTTVKEMIHKDPTTGKEIVHLDPTTGREMVHLDPTTGREMVHLDPTTGREMVHLDPTTGREMVQLHPTTGRDMVHLDPVV
ncbi:uncharacterized protein LOC132743843 [Ruditapes philippinarum]|uniref:uncharacterized protein LOC132743843 n=1 Tax=Ruditapes philippinarum TaxID=129788 RepID=UPI00295BDD00|nr:uncharacterized protein LOC132743843 [Ruditapes philippinarum]